VNAGAAQLEAHVGAGAAENQADALLAIVAQYVVQRGQGRHVQQRHAAQVDDHHAHLRVEAAQHVERLFRGGEEQRPANRIGRHALGQLLEQLVEAAGERGGGGQFAHTLDEQCGGQ